MDVYICNKCSTTLDRGRHPFSVTECGHIYCQGCLHQAEKQCPRCKHIGAKSLPLKEPLMPQISQLFSSVSATLGDLQKSSSFQAEQMKILIERFQEIDKKYAIVKSHNQKILQYAKTLQGRYKAEKARREELERKLGWQAQDSAASSSSNASTPFHYRNELLDPRRAHYSRTPNNTLNMEQSYINPHGFRVPYGRAPRSSETRKTFASTPAFPFEK